MTKGGEKNKMNARELTLDILLEIVERGGLSHVVLTQALSKYQYLEKQDRAFITRVTEGTLEYLIQIDDVIERYSSVKLSGIPAQSARSHRLKDRHDQQIRRLPGHVPDCRRRKRSARSRRHCFRHRGFHRAGARLRTARQIRPADLLCRHTGLPGKRDGSRKSPHARRGSCRSDPPNCQKARTDNTTFLTAVTPAPRQAPS